MIRFCHRRAILPRDIAGGWFPIWLSGVDADDATHKGLGEDTLMLQIREHVEVYLEVLVAPITKGIRKNVQIRHKTQAFFCVSDGKVSPGWGRKLLRAGRPDLFHNVSVLPVIQPIIPPDGGAYNQVSIE